MNAAPTLVRPLLGAVLILAASAALRWLAPAHITPDMAQRLLGVLLGALVVVYANAIPKALADCTGKTRNPAQAQAARRFAGWALVLGGLGYMLASLCAPIGIARPLAASLLAAALLGALARCLTKEAP
jgi:4-hydroxybenzoate polyprenyltransferase